MKPSQTRIIIGLSGGVDSSVAASLLIQEGFQVEAAFMKNWEEEDNDGFCPAAQDLLDAQKICDLLKIRLHTFNFSKEYWDNVFTFFLTEYRLGRTPNPDILCNREIKFKAFLNMAIQTLGADYIATGHYAKNFQQSEHFFLQKAVDLNKDQSYFLYNLPQSALSKTLFPIGHLDKPTVRNMAQKMGFPNFQKKDSTGLCFIGERKFKPFLKQFMPPKPGIIETIDKKALGEHEGLMFYTLGQRQGLHIGGQKNTDNTPWYVVAKDVERNVLTVAQGENHPSLFASSLTANQLHWITLPPHSSQFNCTAKIRYRQKDEPCAVTWSGEDTCKVAFKNPQRAITPGQSVVFYDHNTCLGGGVIQ